MRTLILAILAFGTLYFAWTRFGAEETVQGANSEAVDVEFPSEAPTDSKGAFASLADLEDASAGVEDPGPARAEEQNFVPVANAHNGNAKDGAVDAFDLNALGDPLYEGSLLLHRPSDLQAYLKGAGSSLSKSRKHLLISYFLLATGQYGQVSNYSDGLDDASDVTAGELRLLNDAMARNSVAVREASSKSSSNPLILGVSMALMEREADEAAIAGQWGKASRLLSELLLTEIDAPWAPDNKTLQRWASALKDAQASHRWSPDGEWPSVEVVVQHGDTLVGIRKKLIAERPSMTICTGLIERANKLGRYLRENDVLRVPTDRVRTIVDLSARWLFYLHGNEVVGAWQVAIGRKGEETTPGRYKAGEKTPEPPWFPAGRNIVPYGDPENPLGTRWIGLDGSNSLGIHGTWEPATIGTMASDGCIRLANDDVEELFEVIPKGTEVWVRP